MSKVNDLNKEAAHKYFSASCYNRAWDLMDKTNRSPEEDEQMILLSHASHWHWTQREDYSPKNASIATWQLSRIYSILGEAENARRYGLKCLYASKEEGVGVFYLAYAYEALARAESVAGDSQAAVKYIDLAEEKLQTISDDDEKRMLQDDLATINIG